MQRGKRQGRSSVGKTILYMLIMGVVCVFVAAHAYNLAVRCGLSPEAAHKLPGYGFFAGLALGLGIGLVRSIRDIFVALLVMAVLGGMFWFIGVVVEGFLVAFGVPPGIASWVSRVAFWLGVLLGSALLYATGQEIIRSVVHRNGKDAA
jgi:hypothetical protein